MSQNYTFAQISKLGKYLKSIFDSKELDFLKNNSFEEEEISKISSKCFQPFYLSKIIEEISTNPFSLTVDGSTICGKNLLAMKVKYLTQEKDEKNYNMTSIKNKFVGIKAFEENSSGLTMYNMLESKFLSNEAVMKNLVGVAHDRGSNIIGSEKGLITLLREKNQNFFDLNDPCHSLNLVIKNSLCKLSTDIKTFVIKIHSYFTSPQRKALLAKIQDENNLATKKLKRYVKTRWLSFGNSLERLVDIWESLQIYMEYMNKNKQVDKKSKSEDEEIVEIDYKWFFDLLNNESFKVQINLLTYIINKLNHFNTTFQNQSLEIQNLKILTNECYKTILKIIVPLAKITNENFSKFPTLDREKEEILSLWFMKKEEFIAHISEIPRCSRLSNLSSKEKDQVYKMFVSFLSKMLNLMAKYLPLQDKVIDMLDFVDLRGEFELMRKKF